MSGLGHCNKCGGSASVNYPLLPGSPSFCSGHHNPHDAGPFGCDFSGPDDFDFPVDDAYYDMYSDMEAYTHKDFKMFRKGFVWVDQKGVSHELKDIDNNYLHNIINFLRKKVKEYSYDNEGLLHFLEDEEKYRQEHC